MYVLNQGFRIGEIYLTFLIQSNELSKKSFQLYRQSSDTLLEIRKEFVQFNSNIESREE